MVSLPGWSGRGVALTAAPSSSVSEGTVEIHLSSPYSFIEGYEVNFTFTFTLRLEVIDFSITVCVCVCVCVCV